MRSPRWQNSTKLQRQHRRRTTMERLGTLGLHLPQPDKNGLVSTPEVVNIRRAVEQQLLGVITAKDNEILRETKDSDL